MGAARCALACAVGQVDGLDLAAGQRAVVITDFVNEAIKELAHIAARVVRPANGVRTARIHRRGTRRALRVQDTVNIQTKHGSVPGSSKMSELADGQFVSAYDAKEVGRTGREVKTNNDPRGSFACDQLEAIGLAED